LFCFAAVRTPQSIASSHTSPHGPPPPMPKELRSLRRENSPNPQQLNTSGLRYPSAQPPSYNEVMMREITSPSALSHYQQHRQSADDELWTCSMCTFRNHSLLGVCEACELPRVQGINQPLLQNNQMQRSNVPI
jgi:hypothetical protein